MRGGLIAAASSNVHDSSQIPSYPTYLLSPIQLCVSHGATTTRIPFTRLVEKTPAENSLSNGPDYRENPGQLITYLKSSELGNGIHRRGHSRLATWKAEIMHVNW